MNVKGGTQAQFAGIHPLTVHSLVHIWLQGQRLRSVSTYNNMFFTFYALSSSKIFRT